MQDRWQVQGYLQAYRQSSLRMPIDPPCPPVPTPTSWAMISASTAMQVHPSLCLHLNVPVHYRALAWADSLHEEVSQAQ